MSNNDNETLYIDITYDIVARIKEHKTKTFSEFTTKYKLDKLVYFEAFQDKPNAVNREQDIKHLSIQAKIDLIESVNPEWEDLTVKALQHF